MYIKSETGEHLYLWKINRGRSDVVTYTADNISKQLPLYDNFTTNFPQLGTTITVGTPADLTGKYEGQVAEYFLAPKNHFGDVDAFGNAPRLRNKNRATVGGGGTIEEFVLNSFLQSFAQKKTLDDWDGIVPAGETAFNTFIVNANLSGAGTSLATPQLVSAPVIPYG